MLIGNICVIETIPISNHDEKYFLNTPYTGLLMDRHKDIYCFPFCSVCYDVGRNRNWKELLGDGGKL